MLISLWLSMTMTMQEKQDTNSVLKSSTISLVCILVTSLLGQGPLEIWTEYFTKSQYFHLGWCTPWMPWDTRCLMVSTDQADSCCFYFRISWILMERHWFYFFCPLHLVQGLRSLEHRLLQKLSVKNFDQKFRFFIKK